MGGILSSPASRAGGWKVAAPGPFLTIGTVPEPPVEPASPREDAALRSIVEGVEAETGERFFASLVRHVAEALRVRYAFVSELSADGRTFRTLAVWGNGGPLENFEIPLAGTPCESVLQGELSHYPDRLRQRFPEDVGLAAWEAESYCGAPVLDPSGGVGGHVAIMHDQPMLDGPRGLSILRIFAARVAAELVRQRSERAIRESEERLARVLASAMDAIVTFDRERRVQLWNEAAEKVFGSPATEVVGRSLDRFLTDPFRRALEELMRGFSGGAAPGYVWAPGGLKARRSDGREFPVEATLSHVLVGGRDLCTMILRDVDERRRAEEELGRLHRQNEYLRDEIRAVHGSDEIVGAEGGLAGVLDQVQVVAGTDATVLLTGETGTGKELIARALHARSRRRDRPLIKVNCAALPAGLVESELFGHERGAFTGAGNEKPGLVEVADGGTLFLDEVGEMAAEIQSKFLRVLDSGTFYRVGATRKRRADFRLVAATNRDLAKEVEAGRFRKDLFYRVHGVRVVIPPLRERSEDVPLLVEHFARQLPAQKKFTPSALGALAAHDWPGNVRELHFAVERSGLLAEGETIDVADLPPEIVGRSGDRRPPPGPVAAPAAIPEDLNDGVPDDARVRDALERARWRREEAARILGISPRTLYRWMKRLGL